MQIFHTVYIILVIKLNGICVAELTNLKKRKALRSDRVIQELLNNVSNHLKANNILINFTKHNNFLNIIVEYNGRDFDNNVKKGIGLNNIIERLSSIESIINIKSISEKVQY